MNWRRKLVLLSLLIIAALLLWGVLRFNFPPGEVNYLNYLLLRPGCSIEEVERVIGPFNDPREIDFLTGTPVIRPTNEKGVVKCIWFDKPGLTWNRQISITFVDGRATEFEYFATMP